MHPEITPEPTPQEREAILLALQEATAGPPESPWWRAGVAEARPDCADPSPDGTPSRALP